LTASFRLVEPLFEVVCLYEEIKMSARTKSKVTAKY